MSVTVYRHEQYQKFVVEIDEGCTTSTYTLYDMTVSELGEFIKAITAE